MRQQLSKLEGQLENLFEGSLAKLIGEEISPGTLASQLARTMEDGLRRDEAGNAYAPNEFALTLHPDRHTMIMIANGTARTVRK